MFYLFSKTVDLLVEPLWWALLLGAAGGAVLWRTARKRLGVGLLGAAVFPLIFFSLPAVSDRLWQWLESSAHSTYRADPPYDVVVLLGGMAETWGSTAAAPDWNESIDRLTTTYALLSGGQAKDVIVSGGSLGPKGLPTEAEYLARQLEAWGIDHSRIVVEPQARNTRENATYSKALIDAHGYKRVLIVTSAFHLPRAEGCFRAVGQPVDTLASDVRMVDTARDVRVMPRAEYLFQSTRAIREWVGRLVYRLAGYAK